MLDQAESMLEEAIRTLKPEDGFLNYVDSIWHVLGILSSGLASRFNVFGDRLQSLCDGFVSAAASSDARYEVKWAMENLGCASSEKRASCLRSALSNESDWVRREAYRRIGTLGDLPSDLNYQVRIELLRNFAIGNFLSKRTELVVELKSLPDSEEFLTYAGVLSALSVVFPIWILTVLLDDTSTQKSGISMILLGCFLAVAVTYLIPIGSTVISMKVRPESKGEAIAPRAQVLRMFHRSLLADQMITLSFVYGFCAYSFKSSAYLLVILSFVFLVGIASQIIAGKKRGTL